MKRTKIICTLGPSSNTEEVVRELINNGMNVARFNFSHADHEEHLGRISIVKKLRKELKKPVALLLDTKGPEIRLKKFINNSVVLNDGDSFILTGNDIIGDETKVAVTYSSLPKEVAKGNKILIDDGKVELIVEETDGENIYCKVVHGGKISNHKGVNVPTVHLSMPYLSETDKKDILFGISQDVDFIAASFVRTKEDMINIRKFLDDNGGEKIRIIAKIENQEGIDNFEEILDLACGLMVARGDMGVEVDFEMLPGIQKRIITKCLERGRIVITATQMLDSMINNPSPTRAEISDVANAIFDGSSAIMLSGETANGKYPIETVKTMTRIALRAEKDAFEIGSYNNIYNNTVGIDTTDIISHATCETAKNLNAKAIITITKNGVTARRISRFRPHEQIIASTPEEKCFNQLALSWGVTPVLSVSQNTTDKLFAHAMAKAKEEGYVNDGDTVVITAGVPLGVSGNTNILKVAKIGEEFKLSE